MTQGSAPVALMSCMRNEGIHVVEWLAYHRVIGFGLVVVATNDCTDGSDQLLDALDRGGALQHLANPPLPGWTPQDLGVRRVLAHLDDSPAEWLCHLDSDEFLNIGPGAAPVQTLTLRAGDAHTIALPWRSFGDNGHATWPGVTLPAFTACEAAPDPKDVKFKSLFRFRAFHHASEHMPTGPRIPAPKAVNAAGEALLPDPLLGVPRSRYHPIPLALRGGTVVNHYATRSTDVFLLKNDRGFGNNPTAVGIAAAPLLKYHLNSAWHRRCNRNDATDHSILARWPEVEVEMARLRALPGVASAEAGCRDWFHATTARLLTPRNRRRWTKGAAA